MIKWIIPLGRVTHLTMPLIDVQNPIKSYRIFFSEFAPNPKEGREYDLIISTNRRAVPSKNYASFFKASRISRKSFTSSEGSAGAAGFAGSCAFLRESFIIRRTSIKTQKAMIMKSRQVCKNCHKQCMQVRHPDLKDSQVIHILSP